MDARSGSIRRPLIPDSSVASRKAAARMSWSDSLTVPAELYPAPYARMQCQQYPLAASSTMIADAVMCPGTQRLKQASSFASRKANTQWRKAS